MKERVQKVLQKLQGEHYNGKRAAKRTAAFALALAMMGGVLASPMQGVAKAASADDALLSVYADDLTQDVGNYYYDTYESEPEETEQEAAVSEEQTKPDGQENPDDEDASDAEKAADPDDEEPAEDAEEEEPVTLPEESEEKAISDEVEDEKTSDTVSEKEKSFDVLDADDDDKESAGIAGIDDDIFSTDSEGIDLGELLTGATYRWRNPDVENDQWHELEKGTVLEYNDELQVELNYTVPTGKLWYTVTNEDDTSTEMCYDTLTYTLPIALLDFSASGSVMFENRAVGEYHISNGKVEITFTDKSYLEKNKTSDLSDGVLRFSGRVSDLHPGSDGKVDLDFSEKFDFEFTIKPEPVDLTVKKYTQKKDVANNEIWYRVVISTVKGSNNTNVTLHDELSISNQNGQVVTGAVYDENDLIVSIVKKSSNGQETILEDNTWKVENFTSNGKQGSSFDLVLPAMKAGDVYTVVYKCKLNDPDKIKGDFTVNNVATASAGGKNDYYVTPIVGTMKTSNVIDGLIAKKGSQNTTNHTITWTVELNKNRADLGGYCLRDFTYSSVNQVGKSGTELKDVEVEIYHKENLNDSFTLWKKATLPYTFQAGENEIYQFVYTTPDIPTSGNNNAMRNRAYLTKSTTGEEGALLNDPYSTANAGVDQSLNYWKEGLGVEEDGNQLRLKWKLVLTPVRDMTGWVLYDNLQNGQYLTQTQQDALETKLKDKLGDCSVKFNGVDRVDKATSIQVDGSLTSVLKAGLRVEIEYESTYDFGIATEDTKDYTFENKATFDRYNFSGYNYYHKGNVVQKVDVTLGKTENAPETEHAYNELTDDQLKWDIIITMTEKMKAKDSFTITENLPQGTQLAGLTFKKGDYINDDAVFSYDNVTDLWSATVNGADVSATVSDRGRTVVITVPQTVYSNPTLKNKTITLEVTADLQDTARWEHDTIHKFENTVTITSDALPVEGNSATQTQKIFYNVNSDAISKMAEKPEETQNLVKYTVDVNPYSASYAGGAQRLELIDEMTCPEGAQLFLEVNDVYVYEYTDPNTTQKLSSSEFAYTYEEKDKAYILTFQLPNHKHLKVEYTYRIDGKTNQEYSLKNSALLKGTSSKGTSTGDNNTKIQVQESDASISVSGIALYKVDSKNNGIRPEGAKFTLYKYENGNWKSIQENVTSGSDGKLGINETLKNGVAYRLTETEAPRGYELPDKPVDFYIDYLPTGANLPTNYNGQLCHTSGSLFIPNTPGYATPSVKKEIVEGNAAATANTAKVGETVNFRTTVQAAHSDATSYVLHDAMTGLTYTADSLKVVDEQGNELAQGPDYTLTTENLTDGCAFEIKFDTIARGGKYTVTYSAGVNSEAAKGTANPNPNKTWLTYTEDGKSDKTDASQTTTTVPEGPQKPIDTDIPATPITPATPVEPKPDPNEPEQPADSEPEKPATSEPEEPETPSTPDEPEMPDVPENPNVPVLPVIPETPYEPTEEPELPAASEEPASSGSGEKDAASSTEAGEPEQSASSVLPESPADSVNPGAPGPDNQDGWVLGEHGADSDSSGKAGAPMPDNQKGWVLGAKDGKSLIQTGQLNWPIPVLLALGVALVAVGAWLNHKAKKHREE